MNDQVVLITGGTKGIGAAIAKNFLEQHATVITVATDQEHSKNWLKQQHQAGYKKSATFICDVANFKSCQTMARTIKNKYRRVDVLVNNAGIMQNAPFKTMAKHDWDVVLKTNLDGIFNVTKPIVDLMLANNYGRIINIAAMSALHGHIGQTNYTATKAGIIGFSKSLALETAGHNITVNTVSPGFVATDMAKKIPEEILEDIIASIPMQRMARPEEVARVVAFLAEPHSAYITGIDIPVAGGL